MILTATIFLVCRFLFFLLRNYKISIFFRKFSFWPTLVLIALDGNLQYASYLTAFEFNWFFSSNFLSKCMNGLVVINFFSIFCFCIGCYFLFRCFYGNLAKYFFDNSKNSQLGAWYLMAQYGLRNILLGFAHSIDFKSYTTTISILFMIELGFLVYGIRMIRIWNIFEYKISVWINFTAGFIRLIIIGIFFFEQNTKHNGITYTSPIFVYLISIYMFLGILTVFVELTKLLFEMITFLKRK